MRVFRVSPKGEKGGYYNPNLEDALKFLKTEIETGEKESLKYTKFEIECIDMAPGEYGSLPEFEGF